MNETLLHIPLIPVHHYLYGNGNSNSFYPGIRMKTCTICLELKENARFDRNDASADGYVNQCKRCRFEQKELSRKSREGIDIGKYLKNWKTVDIEWEN